MYQLTAINRDYEFGGPSRSCYDELVKAFSLLGVTVNAPDVRDRDGNLIALGEYSTNITDGDIVEIEVVPKL